LLVVVGAGNQTSHAPADMGQYLDTYGQVREELLDIRRQTHAGWSTFAEYVWQAREAGTDREEAIAAYDEAREAITATFPLPGTGWYAECLDYSPSLPRTRTRSCSSVGSSRLRELSRTGRHRWLSSSAA
jgi:hypothetical protein